MTVTPASLNEIRRFYRVSTALAGLLPAVLMLGFFSAVVAGGRYSDKKGKLPLMTVGNTLMTCGAVLFGWTGSYPVALAAILVMGVGGGFSEGLSVAIVSDIYGGVRRTAMLNGSQIVFAIGAVVMPLTIAKLIQSGIHWQIGYYITAGLCAVSALAAFAALSTKQERPLAAEKHASRWHEVASDRMVIALSLGIMLYVGAECGQGNWLAYYFENNLKATAPLAAASVAFFWAGIGLGRAAAMKLSHYISDITMIRGALALAAICQVVLLVVKHPLPAIIAVPILGFCLGPVWPTILSVAGAAYPNQTGTVMGIVVACGSVGCGLFPWAIGGAADLVSMPVALWTCVILLVVNFGLFTSLQRRSRGAA